MFINRFNIIYLFIYHLSIHSMSLALVIAYIIHI